VNFIPTSRKDFYAILDDAGYQDDFTRTRDGYHFLVDIFRVELPQPLKETPEQQRKRLKAAIATVASLCPVTLAEAKLAARFVSADQQASECLRQINQLRHVPDQHAKLRAQSASMARQADSAMRTLLKLQAARAKRDADPKAGDAAVWAEHRAATAMEAALAPAAEEPVVAVVAAQAAPADTGFVRPDAATWTADFARELEARMARGGGDAVFETESRYSMV
jgi:hypothetical protein